MKKVDDKVIQRINGHIQTGEATLFIGGSHATRAYIYENILREKDIPIIIFDSHNDKGNTTDLEKEKNRLSGIRWMD